MNNDKILLGLACHARSKCSGCPYEDQPECSSQLAADAEMMYKQLERECDQIKRVRDAAVKDIEDAAPCFACASFERNGGDCIGAHVCVDDVLQDALGGRYTDYYWQWRGVEVEG